MSLADDETVSGRGEARSHDWVDRSRHTPVYSSECRSGRLAYGWLPGLLIHGSPSPLHSHRHCRQWWIQDYWSEAWTALPGCGAMSPTFGVYMWYRNYRGVQHNRPITLKHFFLFLIVRSSCPNFFVKGDTFVFYVFWTETISCIVCD